MGKCFIAMFCGKLECLCNAAAVAHPVCCVSVFVSLKMCVEAGVENVPL